MIYSLKFTGGKWNIMKATMLAITLCVIVRHKAGCVELSTEVNELNHVALSCNSANMFPCDVNRQECIQRSQVCNGITECTNASDESVETCGCLRHEFQCNSSVCIDIIYRCDQNKDCADGADELDCETYSCPSTHSKCANHFCVPNDVFCNFINDCRDNSDEENCHYRECFSTEFPCRNGQCQPNALLCDSESDCVDKSDEEDCDLHFQCENGLYVHKSRVCDGWVDCIYNHADETNCGNCTEDQIRCDNGRCIRKSNVCDGVCDCFGTCQDELDCGSLACPKGEMYLCKGSHRCIKKQYLCDGINDCWNTKIGVDEYFCHNSSDVCSNTDNSSDVCSNTENSSDVCSNTENTYGEMFWCPEGRCFPSAGHENILCDLYNDCLHGEDEDNCDPRICRSTAEFSCNSGQCIAWRKRCDGKPDCYDRTDEVGCEKHPPCPFDHRRCRGGQCIPERHWCDYWKDCPDFSDESNCERRDCGPDQFRCRSGQCISMNAVCYNGNDAERSGCADGSHLLNCRNWTCREEDQFKCRFSFCIKQSQVCDGLIDCNMTYWDEYHCNFSCPAPDLTCDCEDHIMYCCYRNLTTLPNNLDIDNAATLFHMRGNRIVLTPDMFVKLDRLTYLDLSENGIEYLPAGIFRSLWRLITLQLENNKITIILNGTFTGLAKLRTLDLKGNLISNIQPYAFVGLSNLTMLDISGQRLSKIESNTFLGLKSVQQLNISGNVITNVADGCFSGLGVIQTLDISNNRIRVIGENVFNGLRKLNFLYTDEYQFCCMAKISGQCFPEPDEFSSCEDLMSNFVLRVSIWILGLIAFWGNMVVVIWRTKDLRNGKVHSFLITNLAIGDFFMGAYLMIIAVVDSYYRGTYIMYDKLWRESDLCKFSGFISTFSSELSVFTLTIITLDRLIVIIFPLKLRRIGIKEAVIAMLLLWVVAFILSLIPLVGIDYFHNFYGRSGVCLALHITSKKPNGWQYSVAVFLVVNFVSFLIICVSYLWMFFVAKKTRSAVRKNEARADTAMAKRMTVIVLTDFFCWIPIILLGFLSLGGVNVPPEVYAWIAVFVLPLNSALNPVIYTISTAPFLRNFRKRTFYFRKSFTGSVKTDTKYSFLDERTSHIWDRKPIYRHLELMRMRSYNNSKAYTSTSNHPSHSEN